MRVRDKRKAERSTEEGIVDLDNVNPMSCYIAVQRSLIESSITLLNAALGPKLSSSAIEMAN